MLAICPDAIVMDAAVKDLDGFTLCGVLGAEPELRDVPVVLVTNETNAEADQLAREAGVTALVRQTPTFEAEIAEVCRLLNRVRAGRRNADDASATYRRRMANQLARLLRRLQEAETRHRILLDYASDAIGVLSERGLILEVNRTWERLLKLPRERMVGRHIREFAAPGQAESNLRSFYRDAAGRLIHSEPAALQGPDGATLYMQFSNARVEIDGRPVVVSIGRDVTAAVASRRQLESSEQKYRTLVEHLPDVVWRGRLDGTITFISAKVERTCGYAVEELAGTDLEFWLSRIHPDDRASVSGAYAAMQEGRDYQADYRWQRKDGAWIWLRSRAGVTLGTDGELEVQGTFADVTAQKQLEEQARQAQKMEAVGQLTGGIAHDFNNILAVILGNGRLLLDELATDDPRREDCLAVLEAGERAASLTRQLLTFSRRQVVQPRPLNVNIVVSGMEKMLRRIIGEDIELMVMTDPDLAPILADPGETEQVLMNLAVNARDAMPRGGQLRIQTSNLEVDAAEEEPHGGTPAGRHVVVTVTDTGCGMDAATLARIFEPFFTTKEVGRGTGLGLSTCYGIVQRSNGHIQVRSEPHVGTEFQIVFPACAGRERQSHRDANPGPRQGSGETILLVEDDELLRQVIGKILERRGYRVVAASGGDDALAAAKACDRTVDLVLSDVIMPGSSGPEVVSAIQLRSPRTRALFMSGYAHHPALRDSAVVGDRAFLQKPFEPDVLAGKVWDVLHG